MSANNHRHGKPLALDILERAAAHNGSAIDRKQVAAKIALIAAVARNSRQLRRVNASRIDELLGVSRRDGSTLIGSITLSQPVLFEGFSLKRRPGKPNGSPEQSAILALATLWRDCSGRAPGKTNPAFHDFVEAVTGWENAPNKVAAVWRNAKIANRLRGVGNSTTSLH